MKKFERSNEMVGHSIADELPSLMFHGDILVNRDLSIAAGWSLQIPNTLLCGNGTREAVTTAIRACLNGLPQQFDWQIRWVQHNRSEEFSQLLEKRGKPLGLASDIVRQSDALLLGLLEDGHISWKECNLFIVRRPERIELMDENDKSAGKLGKVLLGVKVFASMLLPSNAAKAAQVDYEVFERQVAELNNQMRAMESTLQGAGLVPKRLDAQGVLTSLYAWANKSDFLKGFKPPSPPALSDVPLAEVYATSAWSNESDGGEELPNGVFMFGDHYEAVMTLAMPPEELGYGIWEKLCYGSVAKLDITVWGTFQDPSKRKAKLKRILNTLKNSKADDPELRRRRAAIDTELEELGANQDRVWRVFATLRLWGDSAKEVVEAIATLKVLADATGQMGLIHETRNPWAFLRATCPGWTQDCDIYRAIDVTTKQAARIVPFHGQPTYLPFIPSEVGALFSTISSTGGIVNINPHSRQHYNAPHFIISAGTGQGKSVLGASLILELIGDSGKAVMIDRGGSFDGIAAAFGVSTIKLSPGNSTLTINPLFVEKGRLPDPEELSAMLSLLEVMIMSAAQREGRLEAEEARMLREAVQRLLEERPGEERVLAELKDRLMSKEGSRALAANLSVWCANGGEYGTLFDGTNNIPLGGRFTVIDLGQDVRGTNQALTNVLTMLIISVVSQVMGKGVGRKYCIFDEAGVLCQNPVQAQFLEYAYRTFRKTGTGVGALTQKAMDLKHLFSYAPLKFFLRQDDLEDVKLAAEIDHFPPEVIEYISQLQTRVGEYSDFVVVQHPSSGPVQAHLCRNYSTPLKFAMVTSDKEDTFMIQQLMKQNGWSRDRAMAAFAAEYPRGVAFARLNQTRK